MNSELPARLPGVAAAVARGADLINALLRTRFFLAGTAAALVALALESAGARARLPSVFFGAWTFEGTGTAFVAGTDDAVASDSFPMVTTACVAEELEQAESELL